MGREKYPDRPCSRIEIEEHTPFVFYRINCKGIQLLCTECIDLEKTLRLNLKCISEELFGNRFFSVYEDSVALHDIGTPRIFEEKYRDNMRKLLREDIHYLGEKLLFFSSIRAIDGKYNHRLLHFFRLADDKMSPKSDSCLGVIGRQSRLTRERIDLTEYSIDLIIRENAIPTILDAVELPWHVKPESVFIVDSLSIRDILPPRELDLVAVVFALWRSDDRVEGGLISWLAGLVFIISIESLCIRE